MGTYQAPAIRFNALKYDPMEIFKQFAELEQSSVVANAAMNRDRGIAGVNSYERDLGFDLLSFSRGVCRRTTR
jgi:hypothetical protein